MSVNHACHTHYVYHPKLCVGITPMYVGTHMKKYKLKHISIFFSYTCDYGSGLGFVFKYTLNPKVCMLKQVPIPAAGMPLQLFPTAHCPVSMSRRSAQA